ncbi:MAG: hypothetical protein ACI8WM_002966 [Burkholderiaceae bacterium]|jgi:hypothetical protein
MIGDADTRAIGGDTVSACLKAQIGNYKVLGKKAVRRIPQGRLIEFSGFGNAP